MWTGVREWRTVIEACPQLTVDESCGYRVDVRTSGSYGGRTSGSCDTAQD